MKNVKIKIIFLVIVVWTLSVFLPQACKKPHIILQEDLSIGVDQGDENLIFGRVSSLGFDSQEDIYILDWKTWRVQKFDSQGVFLKSISIQKGQGPQEITFPGIMAISPQGKIFLYDFMAWKVLILDQDGRFLNSFNLDFYGIDIGNAGDESLIVMGDKNKKLFHVYDIQGRLIRSFGVHFEVPQNLARFDFPTVKYPQDFKCSRQGRIYVCDPHRYEISVYSNEELKEKINGSNAAFLPVSVKNGRDVTLTGVSVFETGNRIYSFIHSHGEVPNQLDVFDKNRQIASLDVTGYARAVDPQGRLYFTEEEPFPRIIRYVVK